MYKKNLLPLSEIGSEPHPIKQMRKNPQNSTTPMSIKYHPLSNNQRKMPSKSIADKCKHKCKDFNNLSINFKKITSTNQRKLTNNDKKPIKLISLKLLPKTLLIASLSQHLKIWECYLKFVCKKKKKIMLWSDSGIKREPKRWICIVMLFKCFKTKLTKG